MTDKLPIILVIIGVILALTYSGWTKYLDYKLEEVNRTAEIQRVKVITETIANVYIQNCSQDLK